MTWKAKSDIQAPQGANSKANKWNMCLYSNVASGWMGGPNGMNLIKTSKLAV